MRERLRGGKSFFVTPKIKDIHEIEEFLKTVAPELKYKVAHGKLNPNVVDTIMTQFCEGQFDVLVSTTIIGSGIDIGSANTIVIYKSHHLGLSQLYQLRGRVGRSKLRGFAYLLYLQKQT